MQFTCSPAGSGSDEKRCPTTPVALLIFNRPETTARVFAAIRAARPARLLVAADGPRAHVPGERERCAVTRAVTQTVDWPCEVSRLYREENLGCRRAVVGALNWVFEQVPEAIILEDDCLPDPSFFPFCAALLTRYREDDRVGMISGDQFLAPDQRGGGENDYYFSRHCHIWGWATWRRAWRDYDLDLKDWSGNRADRRWLRALTGSGVAANFWRRQFDDAALPDGRSALGTWDTAWTYACWRRGRVAVAPAVNLVQNIGFGTGGTHTLADNRLARVPLGRVSPSLRHPSAPNVNRVADLVEERTIFYGLTLLQRLIWTLRLPVSLRTMFRLRAFARRMMGGVKLPRTSN